MGELLSLAIQVLIGNPLTVSLVILGVICVFLAIVGKIPPMHIEGGRALALGGFGFILIVAAIGLAWVLAASTPLSASQQASPSPTQVVVVVTVTGMQSPAESSTPQSPLTHLPQIATEPPTPVQQGTQQPTTLQATVPPAGCTSTPPTGLIPLWENTEPPWSTGVWGSPNVPNFAVDSGIIDTNDPDFGEFQIWFDPCFAGTIPGHGYTDGGRFWPKQSGLNINAPPIPLGGATATTINIPANTGRWGLGPRY
jgi:hypothetical protein